MDNIKHCQLLWGDSMCEYLLSRSFLAPVQSPRRLTTGFFKVHWKNMSILWSITSTIASIEKDKNNGRKQRQIFDSIPYDIILYIFSLLSLFCVFKLKCVCKAWHVLVLVQNFFLLISIVFLPNFSKSNLYRW